MLRIPDTNELTKYVEEKTGVHIEWQNLTQDGSEKISLMLASNSELPDVFMTSEISNEQVVAYGSQGILIPLNDLIDEQGTNMQGLFEYNDTIRTKISAPDGNIYGLPLYGECYHCMGQQKMWINETWLDNLGLEKQKLLMNCMKYLRHSRNRMQTAMAIQMTKYRWYAIVVAGTARRICL